MKLWHILILSILLWLVVLILPVRGAVINEAYISLSLRTPKQSTAELIDYEVASGLSFPDYIERIDLKFERENDLYYRGLYSKTYKSRHDNILLNDYSAELEINEANLRNEFWIYKRLLNFKTINIRVSGRWDTWIFDGVYLGIASKWQLWENIFYEFSLDSNFHKNTISRHNILARYDIGKLYQQLRVVRHIGSGRDSWQVKSEVGIKWR